LNLLAIDPGNIQSAYVVVDENFYPLEFGKIANDELAESMRLGMFDDCEKAAIEHVACYGMAVGKEVFDTCIWIGRFTELLKDKVPMVPIYRKDEKIAICGSMKAKDGNIRQALIDRFAKVDFKNGKGTKKNPDWFYGFKADIWQAFAVAVTARELEGSQ